jgi:hypothetical protein
MATIVSWPLEEMIISFVMHELLGQERRDGRDRREEISPPALPGLPALPAEISS